jgi:outer membrane protein OmpA-like peptidoglycan-associated protein
VIRRLAALLLAALVAACATPPPAPQGTVVLLPDPDGRQTAVTVTQGSQQITLDQPFAGARLLPDGPKQEQWTAQQVQDQFGAALAARPLPPAQFTLYFIEGKDEFTPESKKILEEVFGEIARRPVPDVQVIGHTDAAGSNAVNGPLSQQRAEVVRRGLVARGIPADRVTATGRGERELAVHTADGVAEPRNRRVEILVR